MGIRNLKEFLINKCHRGIYQYDNMDHFKKSSKLKCHQNGKEISNSNKQNECDFMLAIDTYLYAMKYKRIFPKIELGFLRQILLSLNNNIMPIYIFDGNSPDYKKKIIKQRRDKRQKHVEELNEIMYNKLIQNLTEEENNESKKNNISCQKISLEWDDLYVQQHIFNLENNTELPLTNKFFVDESVSKSSNNESVSKSSNNESVSKSSDDEPLNRSSDDDQFSGLLEENETIKKLRNKCTYLDHMEIIHLKNFFEMLKIPFIVAVGEADELLAKLCNDNIVDACLTDDMDMLARGCQNVIQINKNGVIHYVLDEILSSLSLTKTEFTDLCILFGTDYENTFFYKKPENDLINNYTISDDNSTDIYYQNKSSLRTNSIYNMFIENRSFEKMHEKKILTDTQFDSYINCRKIFTNNEVKPYSGGESVSADKPYSGGESVSADKPYSGGESVSADKPYSGGESVSENNIKNTYDEINLNMKEIIEYFNIYEIDLNFMLINKYSKMINSFNKKIHKSNKESK
jgi:5'-3' exonuclease